MKDKRKRTPLYPIVCLAIVSIFLSACGGSSDTSENSRADTGTLHLTFQWNEPRASAAALTAESPSGDVCVDYEIETINAKVFDPSDNELTSQNWSCADHRGVITGMPTDLVLRLLVEGYVSGAADWRGEVTGITFSGGTDYNAQITMSYIGDDTTSPTIDTAAPAGNLVDVAVDSVVTVTFSEKMVPASLNASTFTLETESGLVSGSVAYDVPARTATFTPDAPLCHNTIYTATVTDGVMDLAANPLDSVASWSFSTSKVLWLSLDRAIVKFSSDQKELARIDEVNCEALSAYSQFAVDPNDNSLWISDTNNDRVMKLDETGEPLFIIDQWSASGTVVDPRDGTAWSSKLYQNPNYNRTLINFSPLGFVLRETAGGLQLSMFDNAMAWDTSDHSIWYANYDTDIVKLMNTAGLDGYDASGPSGTHHLRINDTGQLFEVSVFSGSAGSSNPPCIWAVNRTGNNLIKFDVEGSELWRTDPAGILEVRFVSVDRGNGSVWIGGTGTPWRVAKYAYDGTLLVQPVAIDEYFDTIEADPIDGGLWIGSRESLIRLDAQGNELWRHAGRVMSIAFSMYQSSRANIYVEPTGDDTNGNGSLAQPYQSIGKALEAADGGASIHVGAGTYNEDILLTSNVSIIGAGADSTTIQGSGKKHVVEGLTIVNVTLSGFTITGAGENLSGVYCYDCENLILRKNVVRGNGVAGSSYNSSGVILAGASEALLEKNIVTANVNTGIALADDSTAIVKNNIIADNTDSGLTKSSGSRACIIINNVIDRNGNHDFGRSGIATGSDDFIANNIVTNNGGDNPNPGLSVGIRVASVTVKPVLLYNNVYGNFQGSYTNTDPGTGDISMDPQFENPSSGDYHLQQGSPSINTGNPDLYDPDCTRSDQGAYGGPFGNW